MNLLNINIDDDFLISYLFVFPFSMALLTSLVLGGGTELTTLIRVLLVISSLSIGIFFHICLIYDEQKEVQK